jgi:hypothetical protein
MLLMIVISFSFIMPYFFLETRKLSPIFFGNKKTVSYFFWKQENCLLFFRYLKARDLINNCEIDLSKDFIPGGIGIYNHNI